MSSRSEHEEVTAILCQIIRDFGWGDYGMHEAELGIMEDLEAQEWIYDLARAIQSAGFGDC